MINYNQHIDQNQCENSDEEKIDEIRASEARAAQLESSFQETKLPEGFFFHDNDWLYHQSDAENSKSPTKVCSRLEVIARTRNSEGINHGRLLKFHDLDGICHEWAMPMKLFATDGKEYRSELLDRGLLISRDKGSHYLLSTYIQESRPTATFRCVSRTGWVGDLFVLPDRTIGNVGEEPVIFQSEHLIPVRFLTMGSIADFHRLASYCIGNDLMIFSISLSFAAPLLELIGGESGGFNLVGPSSIGKTKLLSLAASIYGPPQNVQQWRVTGNGLEGLAIGFNDCLLCLDELGQIDSDVLGQALYMLGNGSAKSRGNKSGNLRIAGRWRLLFLSSGEIGLIEHLKAGKVAPRAGHEVRGIDIYVGNRLHGCFDNLHGLNSGADFSHMISNEVSRCYGVVGQMYLEALTKEKNSISKEVKKWIEEIVIENLPKGSEGQVNRVLERFALVAAAGKLATSLKLTPWSEEEVVSACIRLFKQWLGDRGDVGQRESQQIIEQASHFFEAHWSSRFIDIASPDSKTINCAGFRVRGASGWIFRVYPGVFKKEICKGYSSKQVIAVLQKAGILMVNAKKDICPTWRPPGAESQRFYHFTNKVLPQIDEGFETQC